MVSFLPAFLISVGVFVLVQCAKPVYSFSTGQLASKIGSKKALVKRDIHGCSNLRISGSENSSNDVKTSDSMGRRKLFGLCRLVAFSTATSVSLQKSLLLVSPAHAAFGDSTNIELPSYIEFLIEKNTQVDPSTFLYKGVDREVQLQRFAAAATRIQSIPDIVQARKWSQVEGTLTGPLGTLIQTMNLVSGSDKEALRAAAKVKADLLQIGQAAAKKNAEPCIAATESALQSLEAFVKVAF